MILDHYCFGHPRRFPASQVPDHQEAAPSYSIPDTPSLAQPIYSCFLRYSESWPDSACSSVCQKTATS